MSSKSLVSSTWAQKVKYGLSAIAHEGVMSFLKKVYKYLRSNVFDKWKLSYFVFSLEAPIISLPTDESVVIKIATREDIVRVQDEIFPVLKGDLEYDKRYFDLIDHEGVYCFLAEKGGRFIHYSWVFTDVFSSPLMNTPFDRNKLTCKDVYIGPVFTVSAVRGIWVYPHVLTVILVFLQKMQSFNRLILCIQGGRESAAQFYRRFGFKEISRK